jgi:hypothetical protein
VIVAKITTLDKCVTKKRLTRQISMQWLDQGLLPFKNEVSYAKV